MRVLAAVILIAAWPGFAVALPVCARPEVLREVAAELTGRGVAGEIDPGSVGQVDDGGALVRCAVRLLSRRFDTDRLAYLPYYVVSVRQYEVRRLRHGLLVQLAP